jgi:hypothetical protein
MASKSDGIMEKLTNILSKQMTVGQSTSIKTSSIEANLFKNNISLISPKQAIQDIQINFSSYCDLINSSDLVSDCNSQIITQKVNFKTYFKNLLTSILSLTLHLKRQL